MTSERTRSPPGKWSGMSVSKLLKPAMSVRALVARYLPASPATAAAHAACSADAPRTSSLTSSRLRATASSSPDASRAARLPDDGAMAAPRAEIIDLKRPVFFR